MSRLSTTSRGVATSKVRYRYRSVEELGRLRRRKRHHHSLILRSVHHFFHGPECHPFESTAQGDDNKSVTGTIKRLKAGEVVSIYCITEPSSPWGDQKPVVRSVRSDGGLGKEGPPWFPREWREVWPFLAFRRLRGDFLGG
jgi:hypothetical protein